MTHPQDSDVREALAEREAREVAKVRWLDEPEDSTLLEAYDRGWADRADLAAPVSPAQELAQAVLAWAKDVHPDNLLKLGAEKFVALASQATPSPAPQSAEVVLDAWKTGRTIQYLVKHDYDRAWSDYTGTVPPNLHAYRLDWRVKPSTEPAQPPSPERGEAVAWLQSKADPCEHLPAATFNVITDAWKRHLIAEGGYSKEHAETHDTPLYTHPEQKPEAPNMRAVCEALGFDPTNHHNAAKCPYCRPTEQAASPVGVAEAAELAEWLKDGETVLQRLERERNDVLAITGLLAKERERTQALTELLTSAHAIALRQGACTAWDRFAASIQSAGVGAITARTYRVLPEDQTEPTQAREAGEPTQAMVLAGEAEWRKWNRGDPYDDEIQAIYLAMRAASTTPKGST